MAGEPGTVAPFVIVTDAGQGRVHLRGADDSGAPAPLHDPGAVSGSQDGWGFVVEPGEWPDVAARLERAHPRWVWDETTRWYPALLAAGVRVERCVDLRLSHAILRHSMLTADSELAKAPPSEWDAVAVIPAPPLPVDPRTPPAHTTLFDALDIPEPPAPHRVARFGRNDAPHSDQNVRLSGASAGGDGARGTSESGAGGDGPGEVRAGGARGADGDGAGGARGADGDGARGADGDGAGGARGAGEGGARAGEARAGEAREVAEFRRQRAALREARDPSRIALLVAAESAGSLVAAELKHVGLPWSAERHDALLTELLGPRPAAPAPSPDARYNEAATAARPARLEELLARIRDALGDPAANPDSPAELLKSLRRAGLTVTSTRSWELKGISHPAIPPLLEYKKLSRLLTANGWNWLDTWVRDGRFHPHYVPGGVVTGRWASEGGGALQLPKLVRSAVIADEGKVLVVADAAQLEPRILAALAGDRAMAAAGRGRDLYDGIVASGAVDSRANAKLGMLGAMYGGTAGESGRMLPRLARAYPAAIAFVEDAARTGEAGNLVSTRLGRTSPRPSDAWLDLRDEATAEGATDAARARARSATRSWGRFTRNFVVQGTAAEWALCWIGSIRRRLWALDGEQRADAPLEHRPHLSFFLHDEVMVHTPAHLAERVATELRAAAAEAGRLIFGDAPVEFPVTVAIVDSYDKAK